MNVHIQIYHPLKIGFLSRSCNNRKTCERNNLLFVQGVNAFTLVKKKAWPSVSHSFTCSICLKITLLLYRMKNNL